MCPLKGGMGLEMKVDPTGLGSGFHWEESPGNEKEGDLFVLLTMKINRPKLQLLPTGSVLLLVHDRCPTSLELLI